MSSAARRIQRDGSSGRSRRLGGALFHFETDLSDGI